MRHQDIITLSNLLNSMMAIDRPIRHNLRDDLQDDRVEVTVAILPLLNQLDHRIQPIPPVPPFERFR